MKSLGFRLREERRKRNLTLVELSQKTALSKSHLSQIERDVAQPSISTIKKIAQVFGISVVTLFSESAMDDGNLNYPSSGQEKNCNDCPFTKDVKVVRSGFRKSLTLPGSKTTYELVTPDLKRRLEILSLHISPGETSGDEAVTDPPGEKCVFVLNGAMEFRVSESVFELNRGDSIYFPANSPHSWRGLAGERIEVMIVMTPPSF